MFCNKCGREIADASVVCNFCGTRQNGVQGTAQGPVPHDEPIGALGVVCFLVPIVGLILYIIWKDTMPMKAKGAGKAALWGFITGIVLYIVFMAIGVGAAVASDLY